MPALIHIEQRVDYYYYTFTSDDDCLLFFSRLYKSVSECRHGVQLFREQAAQIKYHQKLVVNGDYSFCILDRKEEVIGHSVVISAGSFQDYGLRKIMNQVSTARIVVAEQFQHATGWKNNQPRVFFHSVFTNR